MIKKTVAVILGFFLICCAIDCRAEAKDLGISASAYILIEASTGRVLDAKNKDARLPMASTTKIMTALLTLEQPQQDTYFTVNPTAIRVEGSSMGLREGDQVTYRALAHGMLLSSGNDAANAAAVKIGGSIEGFVKLMNERAVLYQMENTHFVTPSGLHNEEHYSSAQDMATLARYALLNQEFAAICQKTSAKLSFGNPPFDRWLSNHNRLLKEYSGCVGVKTGFTKAAGRCLVSAATRNGVTLICVTLHDPNDWRDHARLFDYGFSVLKPVELSPDLKDISIHLVGGTKKKIPVRAQAPALSYISEEQRGELRRELYLDPFYYAPLKEGELVGEAIYYLEDFCVGRVNLIAGADGEIDDRPREKSFWDRVKEFFQKHVK